MPGTYYERASLEKIPDVDLVVKQHLLEMKMKKMYNYPDRAVINTLYNLYDDYTNEIDRRIEMDIIDIENIEEFIYDNDLYDENKFNKYVKERDGK